MKIFAPLRILIILAASLICIMGQSARVPNYSQSSNDPKDVPPATEEKNKQLENPDDEIIKVNTDLVTIPVRVSDAKGRAVRGLRQEDFVIFENGVPQKVEFFANAEEPITVALLMDMSYSSKFKLEEIQRAALTFLDQLRPADRVMVVSFYERIEILCPPTNDRRVLQLAINGAWLGSGTSVYDATDQVLKTLPSYGGKQAIVLLSDGVDTTSMKSNANNILSYATESDIMIYPFQYQTFEDVQRLSASERVAGEVSQMRPKVTKGNRFIDYEQAEEYLVGLADRTGGRLYKVYDKQNLNSAFANLAEELRKTYSLGYYPRDERKKGEKYRVNVRVNRPGLTVRTKSYYSFGQSIKKQN